jgi:polyphosphate glucokinase
MASVVERVLAEHGKKGSTDVSLADIPVGCGVPGPIKDGVMKTAANLDSGWVDFDAAANISAALGRPVHVINDADAAGMAELAYGEAKDRPGTIILLTVGTGIGSALIRDGRLVPNTELGHVEFHRKGAETLVGGAARTRRGLGWKRWAREFNAYLAQLELYFWPDLIILGGGVSKESSKYERYLVSRAPILKARFLNTSGIIGAAYAAAAAKHENPSVIASPLPASTGAEREGTTADEGAAGDR